MTNRDYLSHVDHTLLKPTATYDQIKELCEDAIEFETASVCIPSCYVERVRKDFPENLAICTVVGFPLGYSTTQTKVMEAMTACSQGADEIDMVINLTDVKNGDFKAVESEIAALRAATLGHVLKVIVETCYLTAEEKVAVCQAVTNAKADYIKTSTGFGTAGATLEDIEIFKANIGPNVKIKAAGGIRTLEDLQAYVDAGCDRVGSSAAVGLVRDLEESQERGR